MALTGARTVDTIMKCLLQDQPRKACRGERQWCWCTDDSQNQTRAPLSEFSQWLKMNKLLCFTQKNEILTWSQAREPSKTVTQNFPFYIFWRNHGILFCFAWTQLKTVTEAEPWLGASHPPLGLWHPLPGALQWGMSTLREHTVLERQQQTPDVNEWLADDFWGGFRQRNRGSLQLTRRWCSPPCEWICFEKLRSIAGGCLANFLRALQKERGKRSTKSHLLLWNRVYQPTVTSYSPARCRH